MNVGSTSPAYRVIYVGTGRKSRMMGLRPDETERDWRHRLAQEQEDACNRMARDGYRLDRVQTVVSSRDMSGGWTEGVWLYFAR